MNNFNNILIKTKSLGLQGGIENSESGGRGMT